jgi:membrane protein DedA with SNARE-associated domain
MGVLELPVVAAVFITAAILGDFVNFWIGSKVGTAGRHREAGVAEESSRRERGVAWLGMASCLALHKAEESITRGRGVLSRCLAP